MKTNFRIYLGRTGEPVSVTYNSEFDIIEDAYFEETETTLSQVEIDALEEVYLKDFKALTLNEVQSEEL